MASDNHGPSSGFWLVQALLLLVVAAAAFLAGKWAGSERSHDDRGPREGAPLSKGCDDRALFPDDAVSVQAAESLLKGALQNGKWTSEQDDQLRRQLFNQSLETRVRITQSLADAVNTKKLKRVAYPTNLRCPPGPTALPCPVVKGDATAPNDTKGTTRAP